MSRPVRTTTPRGITTAAMASLLALSACSAVTPNPETAPASTEATSVSGATTATATATEEELQAERLAEAVALARPGLAADYGQPPPVPTGALSPEVAEAVRALAGDDFDGSILAEEIEALEAIAESGDPRMGWVLSDVLRVAGDVGVVLRLNDVAERLLDRDFADTMSWAEINNHLIAWDVPEPPGYLEAKANIFTALVPQWDPFFQPETEIDWRLVSWGGVGIDDRPLGSDESCACIAAIDDPTVTSAADAGWIDDDAVVFGVVIEGQARAYPRRIMEVREMVNDTLGGRDFGLPYCTLCGSAQLFFTDDLPPGVDRPVLRTSGLLSRSNKMMFDQTTFSLIDTFTGEARSGPLLERGVTLAQHAVVTTTWGQWRARYPETTVLTEDLALGRDPNFRATRDADGPIFPVGAVDGRLETQADVLGVITESGQAVAFHVEATQATLAAGSPVSVRLGDGGSSEVIEVVADGGGLRAVSDGEGLATHQAFWFAWSQFHPDTLVWPEGT